VMGGLSVMQVLLGQCDGGRRGAYSKESVEICVTDNVKSPFVLFCSMDVGQDSVPANVQC
jgi:hypothetical protein